MRKPKRPLDGRAPDCKERRSDAPTQPEPNAPSFLKPSVCSTLQHSMIAQSGSDEDYSATEANLRRLRRSKRIRQLGESWKRRSMTDTIFDILLRRVAGIPSDWKESNETWKQAVKRRTRLAAKL